MSEIDDQGTLPPGVRRPPLDEIEGMHDTEAHRYRPVRDDAKDRTNGGRGQSHDAEHNDERGHRAGDDDPAPPPAE